MLRPLTLLLIVTTLGCSHDLGELYAPAGAGDSGRAQPPTPEEIPVLPALPDQAHRASCRDCAETNCADARRDCLQDDACVDMLRCRGACEDPACLLDCDAAHGISPWYDDYWQCVFSQCPGECNAGGNWGCRGNYDWPAAEDRRFEVVFRFDGDRRFFLGTQQRTREFFAGVTVNACADAAECVGANRLDSAQVGLDNTVRLELAAAMFPPLDHRGYLEIDAPHVGAFGERVLAYYRPLSRSLEYGAAFFPTRGVLSNGGSPPVAVGVLDCLELPGRGVRIELPDLPEVAPLYFVNSGVLLQPLEQTTETGIAVLTDLPDDGAPRRLRVRGSLAEDGALLAERSVWVRSDFGTWLLLTPAARLEL